MERSEFEERVKRALSEPRQIKPTQGQQWTEEPATEAQRAAIFDLARKKRIEVTEKDVPFDMTKGAARALQYDLLNYRKKNPGNPGNPRNPAQGGSR